MKRSIPQIGTKFHDIDAGLNTTVVQPGQNIQDALDSIALTGGKVFLKNGIHYPIGDLILSSNTIIEGETAFGTVIDFGGQPYSMRIEGTDAYSTGTIDTDGSSILVGDSTVWTSDMIGQYILLDGDYHYIASVESATQITLGSDFTGGVQSGLSYVISNPINGCFVNMMTIQNSTSSLVKIQHGLAIGFEKVELYMADMAFEVRDTVSFFFDSGDMIGFNIGVYLNNCYSYSLNMFYVASCIQDGIQFIGGGDSTLINYGISNCGGIGLSFENTKSVSSISFTIDNCGSSGIEFISENSDNGFSMGLVSDNVGDGIKLDATSDTNIISGVQIRDNGGYGINIANSNCDNNIISSNILSGNSSGQVANAGTGTKIRSNIGVVDN